jgi:hypothetical protein
MTQAVNYLRGTGRKVFPGKSLTMVKIGIVGVGFMGMMRC